MIEFVSYNGRFPNLCSGELILKIDNKVVNLGHCLVSGGCVWFEDWNEHVESGAWLVDVPEEYAQYTEKIIKNVPWGCCGGCV